MVIGDRIKGRIAELGLSYRKIGTLVHRSHMTVYGWAHGSTISENDLEKLAEVLETTPEYLRYGNTKSNYKINEALMSNIIAAVTEMILKQNLKIPPAKVGDLAVTLYEIFSPAGEIDKSTISRLLKLSAE